MPIISKETWDKFTQEEKRTIMGMYFTMQQVQQRDNDKESYSQIITYEDLFGKENLQPQPLTYEDVARELFSEDKGNAVFYLDQYGEISESNVGLADNLTNDPTNCTSHKQAEKLLAINRLLNVAKFLNGDWKPDWENGIQYKWFIRIVSDEIVADYTIGYIDSFVYFRTEKLAKQAVTILGEDTVRLALSSDF